MKIVSLDDAKSDSNSTVKMKVLFDENVIEGAKTVFGTVTIPPGVRVPLEGIGYHDQDEYGLVMKGSLLTNSGGEEHRVVAGQATFIPKGEPHWAYNDGREDCEIVWALVPRT